MSSACCWTNATRLGGDWALTKHTEQKYCLRNVWLAHKPTEAAVGMRLSTAQSEPNVIQSYCNSVLISIIAIHTEFHTLTESLSSAPVGKRESYRAASQAADRCRAKVFFLKSDCDVHWQCIACASIEDLHTNDSLVTFSSLTCVLFCYVQLGSCSETSQVCLLGPSP